MDDHFEKIAAECPFEIKLAVTVWVFHHLLAHLREGGTYRYLIYDRLALNDYPSLFDGLDISNAFSEARSFKEAQAVAKKLRITPMKPVLELCDEPDCFEDATCGWPSPTGYRKTCRTHQPQP